MGFWRKLEVFGCAALLTCIFGFALRPMITAALNDAFKSVVLENDINAFLDGRVDTYKGYDYAGYVAR
ncbi:MAG TPA: hypothetical protein EYN91_22820 [Candidatus Melainabacteria bacterium]|nr:hypothetical protein [Candidatus Melainabacteria bacterium]HIN63025.1 hypothetical protein [Candidatus Obscuribacterales bacterium]